MRALQQAARAALERDFEGRPSTAAAPLERLSMSVTTPGGHELVSLRVNGGVMSWSCTCGLPRCEHAHAALSGLADSPLRSSVPPPPSRSSEPPPRHEPSSDRDDLGPTYGRYNLPAAEPRAGVDRWLLAEGIDDVSISIARAGVAAGRSASVGDALARLRRAAPAPLPLGLERWLGRLDHALASADVDEAALLLSGASALCDALRAPGPATPEQHACVRAWLGSGNAHDGPRLTDRVLLEIAREQLAGVARSIERRHLIDMDSGQVYREERVPGGDPTSLGPCPRLLTVSLATLEAGPPPARVHVLQYTATLAIEDAVWHQLVPHAEHDFAALRERYRAEVTPYPGLCEPFALVVPAAFGTRGQNVLLDAAGHALALAGPDGGSSLRALDAQPDALLWLCGRLCDQHGVLALRLAGAAALREGRVYYVQL